MSIWTSLAFIGAFFAFTAFVAVGCITTREHRKRLRKRKHLPALTPSRPLWRRVLGLD